MGSERKKHPLVESEECKGCGRCIDACPKQCLVWAEKLNSKGYLPVRDSGAECIACLRCFYTCPEPYALIIYQEDKKEGLCENS